MWPSSERGERAEKTPLSLYDPGQMFTLCTGLQSKHRGHHSKVQEIRYNVVDLNRYISFFKSFIIHDLFETRITLCVHYIQMLLLYLFVLLGIHLQDYK